MIKSNTIFVDGRKIGTYKSVLTAGTGHINFEGFEPYEPQLDENQKALVIWMQENECYTGDPLESISDLFLEATPSDYSPGLPLSCVEAAYQSLTNQQKLEMVSEYLQQYSEQEEE